MLLSAAVMFAMGGIIIGALVWQFTDQNRTAPIPVQRFTVEPPADWPGTMPGLPTVSRDGEYMVYTQGPIGSRPELMMVRPESRAGR